MSIKDECFLPTSLVLDEYIKTNNVSGMHHLARYYWVLKVLAETTPKTILDLACGEGYGSYLIAAAFPDSTVLGVDYVEDVINKAKGKYTLPNLSFNHGNVMKLREVTTDQFDCIISFDTLEHIPHRELAMMNFVNALNPEGKFIMSTPLSSNLTPGWEFHKIEYSKHALYDFLMRYFKVLQASDFGNLPFEDCFEQFHYVHDLNPIICTCPLVVDNPYKEFWND